MGSFYGNVKAGSQVSLTFDKTYPNRKAMEDAINPEKNAASGRINGDGIYNTRYVFINYGERRYSQYKSVEIQESWHQDGKFTNKCPLLYVYKIGNAIQTLSFNDNNDSNNKLRYSGKYIQATEYNSNYHYYIKKNEIFVDEYNTLTPDGIDENCEYAINKEIDKKEYQDCYDHTVWQKIWCSVTDTSTITEKYIMVASLDAKAPKFESIIDAPDDDDEYELATITYDDYTPVKLSPLNVYYKQTNKIIDNNEENILQEYEEVDLSAITEWNNINCDTAEVNNALKQIENKEFELNQNYPNANLVFSPTHNPDLATGYNEYYEQLGNKKPENWENIQTQFKSAFDTYKSLYNNWILAQKTAYQSAIEAFREKYNGNLYYGLLYQYKAIISDLDYYAPLVDKNGNQSIYSQNILDGMISSLGNIYSKEDNSVTYTLLHTGATYRSIGENGVKISYYHKELKEAGYISENLFNRLKGIPQQLYIIKDNRYIEVSNEKYNINTKYYQRISSKFNHGPHIDTLHSTDLDYKLHNPRNWKFNVKTDFNYNKAGFNPEKQSDLGDKKNQIYLKKTKSGALYPVHMDNKGYKLLNNLITKGNYSNVKNGEKVQLPEAGFYVNNELKYAEQVDQRTFDFNLPEFGTLASKMWDLVYPRGEWIQYNKLPNWINYDDEVYQRGELYYRDPNKPNRYIQVGKNDNLEREVQYYIFQPADNDSTDALRYVFVGNDRATNENDYPKTMAGLIRYIYKLLGLKTDNDYRDMPSEETIYGIYNGLIELLGKWTDNYELNRYIPIATQYSANVEPSREIVLYGLSGDFKFGYIHTKDKFKELHNGAFGPLYIARKGFPKWGNPVDKSKPIENIQYFYKDSNGEYQKAAPFNAFDPSIDYYAPSLLYEKAIDWDENVQYYRDMNSLWGLLREFQRCRDNYQVDWIQDHPGSPSHIQHRPSVIFSALKYEDGQLKWNEKLELSYIQLTDVISQDTLNEKLNDFQNIGSIYYKTVDSENQEVYCKVANDAVYDKNKTYYKLEEPIDINLSDQSINARWTGIAVNRSNDGTINYDPNSGSTGAGQIITLEKLEPTKLIKLIQQVENK